MELIYDLLKKGYDDVFIEGALNMDLFKKLYPYEYEDYNDEYNVLKNHLVK